MEFEITFRDGNGPADLEIALAGVPNAEGFLLLSDEEVQSLSEGMVERDWDYAPSAVAIVAPDEETFSAVRACRAHVGGSRSNRHLFSSRAEAVAWLEDQGT